MTPLAWKLLVALGMEIVLFFPKPTLAIVALVLVSIVLHRISSSRKAFRSAARVRSHS